jgi:hypothetical protein
MLFIASLLYYPLKYIPSLLRIFIFLIYPVGLIIKALQFQQDRCEEDESNRKKKLLLLAFLFIAYSLVEKMFANFDSKFFLLLFMIGGAVFAKEKGYFDQGLEKITNIIEQKKIQ